RPTFRSGRHSQTSPRAAPRREAGEEGAQSRIAVRLATDARVTIENEIGRGLVRACGICAAPRVVRGGIAPCRGPTDRENPSAKRACSHRTETITARARALAPGIKGDGE